MSTPYSEVNWVDGPNGGTPLDSAELGVMDKGIADEDLRNPASPASLAEAALYGQDVRPWAASTVYAAGQAVVSPSGDVVTAVAAFTSGSTYSSANWNLSATFKRQILPSGDTTGATDLSAINGTTFAVLQPGGTYYLNGPIVRPSGSVLDATGATVRLVAGSNCNMLNNTSITAPTTATDGAITSGTNTVTTAVAGAAVGQSIKIVGAGVGGWNLVTTIAAVSGTTLTLANSASTTVSGAAVTTWTRDTDITIIGGVWDRGANTGSGTGGTGVGNHTIRLEHLDRFSLVGAQFKSAAGKYAVCVADFTEGRADRLYFLNTFSDGFHVQGPAQGLAVSNLYGTSGDDFFVITAQDYSQYADVNGDVNDVTVEGLFPVATNRAAAKVMGGPAGGCRNIRIRNVAGSSVTAGGAVWIGDDNAQPDTVGGLLDHIVVENLSTTVPTGPNPVVQLNGVNTKRVRISGLTFDNTASTGTPIVIAPSSATTMTQLILERFNIPNINTSAIVSINANSTISKLVCADWTVLVPNAAAFVDVLGVVTDLSFRGLVAAGVTDYIVHLHDSTTTATVNRASFTDCRITGTSGGLFRAIQGTHVLPFVDVSNTYISGVAWLTDLGSATELHLSNVEFASPTQGLANIRASSTLTVMGAGCNLAAGANNWKVTSGGKAVIRLHDAPPSTTAGGFPTIAAGAGAGTSPTVTVAGTDRAGTVTVTPGTTPAAGVQATVTFVGTWSQTPKVSLTPTNAAAQAAGAYVSSKSTTTFAVSSAAAPTGSMTFDYVISA